MTPIKSLIFPHFQPKISKTFAPKNHIFIIIHISDQQHSLKGPNFVFKVTLENLKKTTPENVKIKEKGTLRIPEFQIRGKRTVVGRKNF